MITEVKTNVMRILEKEQIAYTAHTYDPDGGIDGVSVAAKLGQNPEQVYKTLVTVGKSRALYVFVIPVAEELDLKKAARACGEKAIEMLHVKDLLAHTGYIRGGCSPIGMKKDYPTYIEELAQLCDTICVSAGKIGAQVELAQADLARVCGARFEPLIG